MADDEVVLGALTGLCTVDDQFTAPVRMPFIVEIGHQRETSYWRGAFPQLPYISRLWGIIVCQQAITCPVRIIVKVQMPSCNVWKGFDIRRDAGKGYTVDKDRRVCPRQVRLLPITTIRKYLMQDPHVAQGCPRRSLHGLPKIVSLLLCPKLFNHQDWVVMK